MTEQLTLNVRGGAAMDRHLQELVRRLGDGVTVRVGFLESARYANGTPVAQVAAWNEFGTETAPPRPFFRGMIQQRSPRWGNALGQIVEQQNYDARRSLSLLGEAIAGQLQRSINEFTDPPNAPYTIEKKGFNKPLIDKSWTIRSVDWQVMSDRDAW